VATEAVHLEAVGDQGAGTSGIVAEGVRRPFSELERLQPGPRFEFANKSACRTLGRLASTW
jgi:hypothetical protein